MPGLSLSEFLARPHWGRGLALCFVMLTLLPGCSDDTNRVRQIQAQRQIRMQSEAQQDHLGEVVSLLERFVELNGEKARRQITYHLNRWQETSPVAKSDAKGTPVPEIMKTISDLLPLEKSSAVILSDEFLVSDVNHLRDAYLFHQIADWVDQESSDDPLLESWLKEQSEKRSAEAANQLRTAVRLFDWTVRNVAFEPLVPTDPAPPAPALPFGMTFRGAGYRQSDFETVWRGTGDALQRAGVFTQLCRQASLPATILARAQDKTGQLEPWCAGVLIDNEIFLFEPGLGTPVPGPNQVGIATLTDARRDASVLRRLNVVGFFDYPYSQDDIQQCVALMNVMPEALSPRMRTLEAGLTGNRRMTLYVDAEATSQALDDVSGIAGVRLWDVPILAEVYRATLNKAAERDPILGFWQISQWAFLEANEIESSRSLARGRWTHLLGDFDDDDEEGTEGARSLYLSQRAPEFEIEDLRIDVELQKQYGIRRDLGISPDIYDRQVQQIQSLMRQGKRTATYWLSLVQYDDGRFETASNWFDARVLNEDQLSRWAPAARYNLARCLERVGNVERAIELYKSDRDPQEHGNRLRARLLDRRSND